MSGKKGEFKEEKQIFLDHIQKSGLRRTSQRDLIFDIFLRTEEHLTSEDLYWLVQQDDPSVGHTTVYRTLKLLTEAGLAREVRFGDGKTYYEHHYDHAHHDHMICTECGMVIEFFSQRIEEMQDKMADNFKFQTNPSFVENLGNLRRIVRKWKRKRKVRHRERNHVSALNRG